ncbi:hypothetical protein ACVWYI_004779 [Bradyrhizobium sp. LB13.1]
MWGSYLALLRWRTNTAPVSLGISPVIPITDRGAGTVVIVVDASGAEVARHVVGGVV